MQKSEKGAVGKITPVNIGLIELFFFSRLCYEKRDEDVENIFCRNFMTINLRGSKVFELEGGREKGPLKVKINIGK